MEFDFNHKLDHAFKVDVKKSRIFFDPALEDELKKRLQPTYREAGNRYRRKEQAAAIERKRRVDGLSEQIARMSRNEVA